MERPSGARFSASSVVRFEALWRRSWFHLPRRCSSCYTGAGHQCGMAKAVGLVVVVDLQTAVCSRPRRTLTPRIIANRSSTILPGTSIHSWSSQHLGVLMFTPSARYGSSGASSARGPCSVHHGGRCSIDGLETQRQNALLGADRFLVIDDLHELQAMKHGLTNLASWSTTPSISGFKSSLAGVMPSQRCLLPVERGLSLVFGGSLSAPQPPTLMAFARWRCAQRNLLVSDRHLAQLSRMEPRAWRAMETRLEQLSMAFENGAVLPDHDDVSDLLGGRPALPPCQKNSNGFLEDVASRLVAKPLTVPLTRRLKRWD